jgi:hypothetical protein
MLWRSGVRASLDARLVPGSGTAGGGGDICFHRSFSLDLFPRLFPVPMLDKNIVVILIPLIRSGVSDVVVSVVSARLRMNLTIAVSSLFIGVLGRWTGGTISSGRRRVGVGDDLIVTRRRRETQLTGAFH